ncbi:MAG TPA: glutamine-hydrolyzing GMP synthase, partial [Candidatus Mcinerneyibacterium sp.]|nr:glutamine-hydrolyzing GMP synthase [Candidatus Mcinerneyibacterium sp.]
MSEFNKVLILDFGSQYTQLIARRIRENHVYCEIHPFNISFKEIERFSPDAVVLSGGPSSVLEGGPKSSKKVLELNVPILGICYGLQLMMNFLGGKVEKGEKREFGFAKLKLDKDCKIFNNVTDENDVWMSHGDKVTKIPENFIKIAHTNNTEFAAIKHKKKDLFGVQFHPEVVHTEYGDQIIRNFLFKIAKLKPSWTMGKFIEESIKK